MGNSSARVGLGVAFRFVNELPILRARLPKECIGSRGREQSDLLRQELACCATCPDGLACGYGIEPESVVAIGD